MNNTSPWPLVHLAADVAAFSVRAEGGLSLLMIKRGNTPYRGRWALPGGFVDEGERVERAARREFAEETGVKVRASALHELGAYTAPRRDPRYRTVSVVYCALLGPDVAPVAGDDAAAAQWLPLVDLRRRRLAFDHATVVGDAVTWLQGMLETRLVAPAFLGDRFTVAELREVYEAVWGRSLDPGNFQRKLLGIGGLLQETGERAQRARGRPGAVYTPGPVRDIWPPLSRRADR